MRNTLARVYSISSAKLPVILALDLYSKSGGEGELLDRCAYILSNVKGAISGVKIGLPLLLTLGRSAVRKLIEEFGEELFFIADLKIADIGHVGTMLVEGAHDMGFDGIITHTFIGYEGALDSIVLTAKRYDILVFGLVAMSHAGAEEVLNKNFATNLDIALKARVDGLVLPANRPSYIVKARSAFDGLIISPGIGIQGAAPGSAIKAGANFEIIGRMLYDAPSIEEKLKELFNYYRY